MTSRNDDDDDDDGTLGANISEKNRRLRELEHKAEQKDIYLHLII